LIKDVCHYFSRINVVEHVTLIALVNSLRLKDLGGDKISIEIRHVFDVFNSHIVGYARCIKECNG
jgi:hypothetical protein